MVGLAIVFVPLFTVFVARVGHGTGSMYKTNWITGWLGILGIALIPTLAPPGVSLLLVMPLLAANAYLAYTVKLPERFIDWSISTRAYTNEAKRERNYTHVRLWNIPKPLFSVLVKHKWATKVGLLLPGEYESGTQLASRPTPAESG